MTMVLPNPEKGFCPKCEANELFVPLYYKGGNYEWVTWKCTKCDYQIKVDPNI
jgi:hypothetical protein